MSTAAAFAHLSSRHFSPSEPHDGANRGKRSRAQRSAAPFMAIRTHARARSLHDSPRAVRLAKLRSSGAPTSDGHAGRFRSTRAHSIARAHSPSTVAVTRSSPRGDSDSVRERLGALSARPSARALVRPPVAARPKSRSRCARAFACSRWYARARVSAPSSFVVVARLRNLARARVVAAAAVIAAIVPYAPALLSLQSTACAAASRSSTAAAAAAAAVAAVAAAAIARWPSSSSIVARARADVCRARACINCCRERALVKARCFDIDCKPTIVGPRALDERARPLPRDKHVAVHVVCRGARALDRATNERRSNAQSAAAAAAAAAARAPLDAAALSALHQLCRLLSARARLQRHRRLVVSLSGGCRCSGGSGERRSRRRCRSHGAQFIRDCRQHHIDNGERRLSPAATPLRVLNVFLCTLATKTNSKSVQYNLMLLKNT